jgi:hypothetical protein
MASQQRQVAVGDAGGVVCDPQRSGFLCELDSREYVSNHSSRVHVPSKQRFAGLALDRGSSDPGFSNM